MLAAPAWAQDRPQNRSQETKTAPALNADAFKVPPSAFDTGKFDYTPPATDSGSFHPGRFKLGSSVLQLDTKRQGPANRVGIEAVDPALLGGIRKDEPTLPHYFGMTLTKPLN